jgi:putative DNA primase/helicase
VAKRKSYHPVRDFLTATPWDGVDRLDNLLARYFGAEASPYASAIGRCTMVAAVARVMRPGCKVDTMLILEGEGGTFKSTALRVLAGDDWFTDAEIDPTNKDAALAIRGRWIVEMGELHALRKSEANQLKAWVSRQTDRQRDPFARRMCDHPRQSVFIGTTNQDHYLKDETGNRRYWPCRCGVVDVEALRADRAQLWAEALARFTAGEPWWLTADVEAEAVKQQAERFITDPWEERIAAWLDTGKDFEGKPIEKTTAAEILTSAVGVDHARITPQDCNRVAAVMRRLLWPRMTVVIGNIRVKGYKKP